ncbi:GNAT family N-acetyltransferase [Kitasatospora purpeofusca]|uniref:GNAT family N-acetyltransferase n=1 Tax=Kitasatospora purpeofusca TaxID=67352 RepID=UPI002E1284B5|nr:GNAT family N-acetyltransferase [Kitasatospora purpeofusca]WSR37890.1 GNAT family N-acetyltransferase [Kitasatospora purpeofusca]
MTEPDRRTAVRIREARASEGDAVAGLVAAAFADLPLHHWLVPDPDGRASVFHRWFRLILDHALAHGSVEVTDDLSAAAAWLPGEAPPLLLSDTLLEWCCGPWWERFRAFQQGLDRLSPPPGEHTRLELLAVRPARQGQGLGRMLMARRLATAHARPIHLEAPTQAAHRFYLRHGFTDNGTPLTIPGSGTRLFPLVSATARAPLTAEL